ncbi:MAG: histidinol-phosphate transaminase [Patescibacteria group bacterium]
MIKNLVKKSVLNLKPYICARHLYKEGILLDANENSFGSVVGKNLNRYPDPECQSLKTKLAEVLNVKVENLLIGSGSDEIIDLLMRVFLEKNDEVILLEPTYGMYRVAAEINESKIKVCNLDENFQINLAELNKTMTNKSKLIFCASPNNPTGNLLKKSDLLSICKTFKGLLIIDEAYIDFAAKESVINELNNFPNLVVLRTFSKAWGLAGLRVGYAIANPEIINFLRKVKPPYNINTLSANLVLAALNKPKKLNEFIKKIQKEKTNLILQLKKLSFEIYPSDANFILLKSPKAQYICRKLATDFKIIIRDFSDKPGLKNCFRITIGTAAQNKLLINSLKKII